MQNFLARCRIFIVCLLLGAPSLGMAADPGENLLLLLRHAYAPGTGDPPQFDITDCATQRNLNAQGQAQSRAIGQQLQALGITPTAIWSSQWCRSFQTAELIGMGPVTALPALNSFFQRPELGPAQMRALREFIKNLEPNGGPYLMVSHQVVVSALANRWVNSGDGVWLILTGDPNDPWKIVDAPTSALRLPSADR